MDFRTLALYHEKYNISYNRNFVWSRVGNGWCVSQIHVCDDRCRIFSYLSRHCGSDARNIDFWLDKKQIVPLKPKRYARITE